MDDGTSGSNAAGAEWEVVNGQDRRRFTVAWKLTPDKHLRIKKELKFHWNLSYHDLHNGVIC